MLALMFIRDSEYIYQGDESEKQAQDIEDDPGIVQKLAELALVVVWPLA